MMDLRPLSAATIALLLLLSPLGVNAAAQKPKKLEKVLISASKPYGQLIGQINLLGGKVTYEYEHIDGLAAEVPEESIELLRNLLGPNAIRKDSVIANPAGGRNRSGLTGRVVRRRALNNLSAAGTPLFPGTEPHAGAYALNLAGLNLRELHRDGLTGEGVIVAVMDSGIIPGYPALESDQSIICGFDLIGRNETCSAANVGHGTFVAGMISGNVALDLTGSYILPSLKLHSPQAFVGTSNVLPLVGSAPRAKIYAIRVFDGLSGTNESVLIEAINRVITLRKRADEGKRDGVKIQVVNLSAGSVTLDAGRELLERSLDALLKHDIVPVVSMGNTGPSGITGGSPGTAFNALTVGAASHAANERIWREWWGVGSAADRPTSHTQTYIFSSRGPLANGRMDPDIVTSGEGNIGQGWEGSNDVSPESGTSYSAPIASGVAALLRQAFPGATAGQIFNAMVGSANPNLIQDGSTAFDRGRGLLDAKAAYDMLQAGGVPTDLPAPPTATTSVERNIEDNTGLLVEGGFISRDLSNLKPGERGEILYLVRPHTTSVSISITNFHSSSALDDFTLFVHTSKTSSIGAIGDYLIELEPTAGGNYIIPNPEPGVMRITLLGSSYNLSTVSARVTVTEDVDPVPQITLTGAVRDGRTITVPIRIQENGPEVIFDLSWENGWESYPTNDIDFFVRDPRGFTHTGGASLDHPEKIVVPAPAAGLKGTWQVVISGFEVPEGSDNWKLRVIVNGKVVN